MNRLERVEKNFITFFSNSDFFQTLKDDINNLGDSNELILDFTAAEKDALFSCCKLAFGGIGDVLYYPTHEARITQLFYSIIKGHKLRNGNKRAACFIILLYYFLWVLVEDVTYPTFSPENMYELSVSVAESSDETKAKAVIKAALFSSKS